ncbi:hypothetical protein ABER06_12245 [Cutibacterium acnes]
MGWGAFAKAGADATNSFIETYAKGKAEQGQMRATQRENERLNKQSWAAMAQRINTVNLQRGILRQQTGTDLYNIGKEANRAYGTSTTSAAAAGVEGVSIDETASDIQRQNQESQAQTRYNELIQEMNLDTSIEDIVNTAVASQRYSQKPTSTGAILGRAIGVSSMQFISSLAQTSFNYMPSDQGSAGGTQGGVQPNSVMSSGFQSTNWSQRASFSDFNTSYSGYKPSGYFGG